MTDEIVQAEIVEEPPRYTVAELIEKLSEFPQHLPVTISGYEGGVTEVIYVHETKVIPDANPEGYYGEHEEGHAWDDNLTQIAATMDVLLIGRHIPDE